MGPGVGTALHAVLLAADQHQILPEHLAAHSIRSVGTDNTTVPTAEAIQQRSARQQSPIEFGVKHGCECIAIIAYSAKYASNR